MYTPYPPTTDPMLLQVRFHQQSLEQLSERIHLEQLARASRPRRRALLPALVGWLRTNRTAAAIRQGKTPC